MKDEAEAAQHELDEFFGAQFTPDSAQSPHSFSNAPSVLAGAAAPASTSHEFDTAKSKPATNENLSHVDDSGRASMVDVAHVCSPTSCSKLTLFLLFLYCQPQVSQERSSYSPLLSVTPVVDHMCLHSCGSLFQCFYGILLPRLVSSFDMSDWPASDMPCDSMTFLPHLPIPSVLISAYC